MGKIFRILFLGLFALIGLSALLDSLWSLHMAHLSETWPHTTGTVLKAYCFSSHGAKTTSMTRHVWYQYQINGKTYTSDKEHFGIPVSGRACVAGYSDGQTVNVYFDPTDPSDAVLVPGSYSSSRFGIAFGLIFVGVAAFGYWRDVKKRSA
jgi:hypothetical protein